LHIAARLWDFCYSQQYLYFYYWCNKCCIHMCSKYK
jgi:hypothetical protein